LYAVRGIVSLAGFLISRPIPLFEASFVGLSSAFYRNF